MNSNENPTGKSVETAKVKDKTENSEKISGGTIALIIVFVLFGTGILGGIFCYFWNKRKINK